MQPFNIIIADDHKILRAGLRTLLQDQSLVSIINEADSVRTLLEVLDETVHVVLMDIDLGDGSGIDATRTILKKYPNVRVLAVTMHEESKYIHDMVKAGAHGYILKDAGRDELLTAIEIVGKGGTFFTNSVTQTFLNTLDTGKKQRKAAAENEILSDREIEILTLIAQEYSNQEIADKLFISIRTVDSHRRNLLDKLQAKNTAGLVKHAITKGYIS